MEDFVNAVSNEAGSCGGNPVGMQGGPMDGSGLGAEIPVDESGAWIGSAIIVGVLAATFLAGFYMRGWVHFKKKLPNKIKDLIAEGHNELEQSIATAPNFDKLLEACSKIDRMLFAREDARKAAAQFTTMTRALAGHYDSNSSIKLAEVDRAHIIYTQVCRGILADKRWFRG